MSSMKKEDGTRKKRECQPCKADDYSVGAVIQRVAIVVPVIVLVQLCAFTMNLGYELSIWTGAALFVLAVIDWFYARHTKARYFTLHVIVNFTIAIICTPDTLYVLADPLNALKVTETTLIPTALVVAIHAYHVAAFDNLHWVDWLHHGLMIGIATPMLIAAGYGPLMNYNNWFVCGVPGGVDYAMLWLVKHGMMKPLKEKQYNTTINVWGRAPFLLFSFVFSYLQTFHILYHEMTILQLIARVLCMGLQAWNAQYFMSRVVGNYHVCTFKAKLPPAAIAAYEEHMRKKKEEKKNSAGNGNGNGKPLPPKQQQQQQQQQQQSASATHNTHNSTGTTSMKPPLGTRGGGGMGKRSGSYEKLSSLASTATTAASGVSDRMSHRLERMVGTALQVDAATMNAARATQADFESDDHFAPGPMGFRRVTLSSQDLQALANEHKED